MGRANAAVFPLPVLAHPIQSLPELQHNQARKTHIISQTQHCNHLLSSDLSMLVTWWPVFVIISFWCRMLALM